MRRYHYSRYNVKSIFFFQFSKVNTKIISDLTILSVGCGLLKLLGAAVNYYLHQKSQSFEQTHYQNCRSIKCYLIAIVNKPFFSYSFC